MSLNHDKCKQITAPTHPQTPIRIPYEMKSPRNIISTQTYTRSSNPRNQLNQIFLSFVTLFLRLRRLVLFAGSPPHAFVSVNVSTRLVMEQCFSSYIASPGAPSETLSERLMRSCARHRLVAASSRSTDEKVASRSGSGRHWRKASRALLLSLRLQGLAVFRKGVDGLTGGSSAPRA